MTRLLSDESGPSGTHQRFIVQVKGSAQTLLIENNIDVGKRVPLVTGDAVVVHGEYIWNEQGGLIHFTHHDPDHSHEGGWIESKGVRYSSQATSDAIAAMGPSPRPKATEERPWYGSLRD